MIRRLGGAALGLAAGLVGGQWALSRIAGRGAERLLAAPRRAPGEEDLGPALDALGGEIVAIRSRDGLRLSARWLPAASPDGDAWGPDPREAVLLLHGWSGSVAPDLVEYGPVLRRTAGVLGLDLRGHGESDNGQASFGVTEVDDLGGALRWLGERGVRRVALVGSSMGAVVALVSVAVLGDGSLAAADAQPDQPIAPAPVPRPRIVAVVAESVPAELPTVVAGRLPPTVPPLVRRRIADRIFAAAADRLGADPRVTEPLRVAPLVAPVPVLLIHGTADELVPVADGERLAAAIGPTAERWIVPGGRHSRARHIDPAGYDARVSSFLRAAFATARGSGDDAGILAAARPPSPAPGDASADGSDQGG